ncbi:Uncharacterized protein PECH_004709 [Penicillium ucsense]|uniref:Velvet domain-containing protein n=1 Tax=Penicillium ucsense TaxID=2839758 RepID=A0A8J8WKP0_9EURO|nr:Uncharacterized protein PECM_003463 [Penicillium ucsense]KAF7736903.1 Uncharacterized protein PECH_004709 [Penicillium ucsense]
MTQPREFHLTFEIPPPTTVRPGLPFTIPVVVSVRAIGTPSNTDCHLVASASLRNDAGTSTAAGLGGNLTAMVRSRDEPSMNGYAKFTGLMISQPGKYRLRIMLSTSSVNGVVTKEFVDSGVVHVQAAAPAAQRTSPATIATLQQLTVENLDISAADIARWQSA